MSKQIVVVKGEMRSQIIIPNEGAIGGALQIGNYPFGRS